MAQAEHITTAIRELMSRGRLPKSTNRACAAHGAFVAAVNRQPAARNAFHPYWRTQNQCRRLALSASASLTRRRIASEREGLSGSRLAQSSICNLSAGDSRTAVTGSCPVLGRPRFFRTTGIDFVINLYYGKASRWEVAASHRP